MSPDAVGAFWARYRDRREREEVRTKAREWFVRRAQQFIARGHGGQAPQDLGAPEVRAYLDYLADVRRVSASTHNQALCALVFLHGKGLGRDPGDCAFASAPPRREPLQANP